MNGPPWKPLLGASVFLAVGGLGLVAWSLVAGDPWRHTATFALVTLFGATLALTNYSAMRARGRPRTDAALACVVVGLSALIWIATAGGHANR